MTGQGSLARTPGGAGLTGLGAIGARGATRTSDLVFAELLSAIRDLRLEPGQSLSESGLSGALGVSRTPIREALSRLTSAGLVQVLPQVGTRIGLIDAGAVVEAQFVRENLELGAYRRAGEREKLDIDRLRRVLDEQHAAMDRGDEELFFATDEALHRTIFDLAGLVGVWDVVERTKVQMDRLRRLTLPEASTARELFDEHVQIVDALDQRTDPLAQLRGLDVLRAHSRRALEHLPRLQASFPTYFTQEKAATW